MLRYRRDTVFIEKPCGRLKKYDLPVYRRSDGSLIMHRVLEVYPNCYTMCGDHQVNPEPGIRDEQIIAVMKGFYRDEKYISADDERYVKYCRFWCKSLKRRKVILFFLDFKTRAKSYIYKVLKSRGLVGGSE